MRRADSGALVALNSGLRREFAEIVVAVRGVLPGDVERARIIADHLICLGTVMRVRNLCHQEGVFPLLIERAPRYERWVLDHRDRQRSKIDPVLRVIDQLARGWAAAPVPTRRNALADELAAFLPTLQEHLDVEDRDIVPLIDRYVNAREWAAVAVRGKRQLSLPALFMAFGMMLDAADHTQREMIKRDVPWSRYSIIGRIGPRVYAQRRRQVHSCR